MAFAPVVYSQFYLNELPWQFIEKGPQFWYSSGSVLESGVLWGNLKVVLYMPLPNALSHVPSSLGIRAALGRWRGSWPWAYGLPMGRLTPWPLWEPRVSAKQP